MFYFGKPEFCLDLKLLTCWITPRFPVSPPECSHANDWRPDDGVHGGDDQHWEGGGFCQTLLHLQCLKGAALWPGGRHGLLDQQGSNAQTKRQESAAHWHESSLFFFTAIWGFHMKSSDVDLIERRVCEWSTKESSVLGSCCSPFNVFKASSTKRNQMNLSCFLMEKRILPTTIKWVFSIRKHQIIMSSLMFLSTGC